MKSDVQGTMRAVFEKYDGKNSESAVMDYLQENVRKPLKSPEGCLGKNDLRNWGRGRGIHRILKR